MRERRHLMSRQQKNHLTTALLRLGLVMLLIGLGVLLWRTLAPRSSAAHPPEQQAASSPVSFAGTGAVSVNGKLLLTSDAGAHWQDVTPPGGSAQQLGPTYFLTALNGWVATSSSGPSASTVAVLRTSDSGHTWTTSHLPTFPEAGVMPVDMRFLTPQHGWLVVSLPHTMLSNPGMLFTTADSVVTWVPSALPVAGSVQFLDTSRGWLVGGQGPTVQNLLYATHDGGQSWQQQAYPAPTSAHTNTPIVGSPAFFTPQAGILAINFRTSVLISSTHDGGQSWNMIATFPLPDTDSLAPPLLAVDGQSGWVVVGSQWYTTTDGGQKWQPLPHSPALIGVVAFAFHTARIGWAVTSNSQCSKATSTCTTTITRWQTADGGATWLQV
jgi:photosystem II stability/assembly factor-like uncharacterized protein